MHRTSFVHRLFALSLLAALVVGVALPRPAHAVLQGTISAGIDLTDIKTGNVEAVSNIIRRLTGWNLTNGTGANQADRFFADVRTLSASANEDIDLQGTLANQYGTVIFAKVKAILIVASSTNTNNVVVTRPASNGVPIFSAASDALSIPPGGWFMVAAPAAAGWASVTASTADLINIANSAGSTSVSYAIVIIGTSA